MAPSTDPEDQLRRLLPEMRAQQTAREQHHLMQITSREQELIEVQEQTSKLEALVNKLFDRLRAAGFPGGYPISKYAGWRLRWHKCWEIGLAYDNLSEHDIPDALLLLDDRRLALCHRYRITHLDKDRLPSAWYSLGRGREHLLKGELAWLRRGGEGNLPSELQSYRLKSVNSGSFALTKSRMAQLESSIPEMAARLVTDLNLPW